MKRRILLADDSVTIQKVIELTFMDEDYEVRAVSNGDEAIAALPEVDPDFVIADVHMPGANGYEVCRRAKARRPDLPVLLLVGTFEPFDEAQARAAGADSFLKKPFDSQELLQRVDELISRGPAPAPAIQAPEPSGIPAAGFELPLTASPEAVAPETAWPSFELEAEAESSLLSMPPLEPLPEEPRYEPAAASPFLEEESPFAFEEPAPLPAPETLLPAGEPLFNLEAPAAFPAAPEEPFAAPEGATVRVETFAGGELRIEEPTPLAPFPAPEPEPFWPAPAAPPAAAPPPPRPPELSLPPTAPMPMVSAEPAASNGGGRLSDDDVDRIARRVVELLGDKPIRDVAWEVVPDLAELVIRERLRELESQAEDL